MIRKMILIGGAAAVAAGAPLTALAATGAMGSAAPATATCTGDQQRLHLQDGSGDGLQARAGEVQYPGALGYATGPQDGTGEQHQGPAAR